MTKVTLDEMIAELQRLRETWGPRAYLEIGTDSPAWLEVRSEDSQTSEVIFPDRL